jgi:N-methylhydantoinase B
MIENTANPITVEVIRSSLESAVAETGATITKLAHSLVFAECKDFSVAVFTWDGELLAQAQYIAAHQGGMKTNIDAMFRIIGKENLYPGDVIMTNDPYLGGLHSQDLMLIKPLFYGDELVAFAGCVAHRTDMGGMTPGSWCPGATEIYQEAIRFPCVKLVKKGEIDSDIMRTYMTNVRLPEDQEADTTAQLAALNQCDKTVMGVIDKYGLETYRTTVKEILDISERRARLEVEKIPDGTYTFTDYTEHDGITDRDWAIKATVTIDGTDIYVDFTGTDEQAKGFINSAPYLYVPKTWQALMYWADNSIPKNQGLYRPFKKIFAPKGTIVNPELPAPVSGCPCDTGGVILDAVLSAFTAAQPEKGWATWSNANTDMTATGIDPETGKRFIYQNLDGLGCGGGARPNADGWEASHVESSNMMIPSIEITERNVPLRYIRREFVQDHGGDGKYRGGTGIAAEYEVLSPMEVNVLFLRQRHPSPGAAGGFPGGPSYAKATIGGKEIELPQKVIGLRVNAGDRVTICMYGGGGYGDPKERDPELVKKDLKDGFISADKAKNVYGYDPESEVGR